jgi:hypothetical protein
MAHCWELRGCDDEMQSRCPHNIPGEPCPPDCHYAACSRPTHDPVNPLDALMNPEIDRQAAIKTVCRTCRFFLSRGPKIA